jgi:hypothetical protein
MNPTPYLMWGKGGAIRPALYSLQSASGYFDKLSNNMDSTLFGSWGKPLKANSFPKLILAVLLPLKLTNATRLFLADY